MTPSGQAGGRGPGPAEWMGRCGLLLLLSFPGYVRALRHKPQHRRLPLLQRDKGLDSTRRYVPHSASMMAAALAQGPGLPPSSPTAFTAHACYSRLGFAPNGADPEGVGMANHLAGRAAGPAPPLCSGFPAARVSVWVREAAAGLGKPCSVELGSGDAPRLGRGGEEPPPCRSPRALNSPELGQSLALLPASVASLNSRERLSSALGGRCCC